MSGFFTSTMSVWELVQNRRKKTKQKETKRTSENERERERSDRIGWIPILCHA